MSNGNRQKRIAVYPGSFDPLTNGHLDIARRALRLFDTLIIAVYAYPEAKNPLFSVEERMELWQKVLSEEEMRDVRVDKFTELLVEYVTSVGAHAIVKGLRSPNDFESEFQQGLMNHKLAPDIETICLFTNLEQLFVSSSLLKEVARLGGDVADMLPPIVALELQKKFGL
ncbi:MAG TPA: pantetheine-phosphate adenylyltransferase [Ktedonobacteraceae bacterium]|nr:pantetheine-phosphate adenylyltransferase [Ktedonobacteraceae bacterium]